MLKTITEKVIVQQKKSDEILKKIQNELKNEKIIFINENEVLDNQVEFLNEYFIKKVSPSLVTTIHASGKDPANEISIV